MKALNLTNKKFGRLTIIGLSNIRKCNQRYWSYVCECGNKGVASTGNLQKGAVKSCGCGRVDNMRKNETHSFWKGDEVGYHSLHAWVKRHLEKPLTCRDCNQIKPLDLANISQEYKRDLTDWEWLCRRCHMTKDGRLTKKHSEETKQKMRHPHRFYAKRQPTLPANNTSDYGE